jgi:uncharacterized protein
MPQLTDSFDLARLAMSSGEARRLDLHVALEPFNYGGQRYEVAPSPVSVTLDISRTMGSGWALRLRFQAGVQGPCMRCLEPASPVFPVDAREVEQPGGGDELSSPYVDDGELDVAAWSRDALALAMPPQITCRPDCLGLCPQCGLNLNDHPGHAHERPPDNRWAKLSEIKFDA